jgi:hypothetical protein
MNYASPQFFLIVLGITLFLVVIVVLWRNISWAPRGITPKEMVDHFGVTGMLPNSKPIRYGIVGLAVILLIFGALALFPNSHDVKQALQSPSLKTVWAATKDYWLWVLLVGVAAFVSLSFLPKEKETLAKTLKWVLAWMVFCLFIVFPLLVWMGFGEQPKGPQIPAEQRVKSVVCPDVNARENRKCLLTTTWSNWIQFADGAADNGKQLCFTQGAQFERKDENGTSFWRFRVSEGTITVGYRLFPGDKSCPAALP